MKGLLKRKGSDLWQGRFRVPTPLWNRREKLVKLGVTDVPKVQEHTVSTKQYVKAQAEITYTRQRDTWNRKMDAWEKLLRAGPQKLSHKQLVALANEYRLQVVKENEEEPFEYQTKAVDFSSISLEDELPEGLKDKQSDEMKQRLVEYLKTPDGPERIKLQRSLVTDFPELLMGLGKPMSQLLEHVVGDASSAVLSKHMLNVNDENRDLLNLAMLAKQGEAARAIEKLQEGSYSGLDELAQSPKFKPSSDSIGFKGKQNALTFEEVLKTQEQMSEQKLDKQFKSPATFRKFRGYAKEFARWRNSDSLVSVTFEEVERWRDELLEVVANGKGKRTTIELKVTSIRSLISWAIHQNNIERRRSPSTPRLFQHGNPLKGIDLPSRESVNSDLQTYTLEQARAILTAARDQSKPSLRWIPWLQAYSGMRVSEAEYIRKEDVKQSEGVRYYEIRSDDEHRTKTGKSRRIPIHQAILDEGFMEFVDAAPAGRLFKEKRLKGNMREWVHKAMEPLGGLDGRPPTHGWRHLFTDISEGKLDVLAQYYIEGRAEPGSRESYGKSLARLPELAKAVNNIESLL